MDFVTIVFYNPVELALLKLQAYSFKFVDPTIINTIYVIYNDTDTNKEAFLKEFEKIKKFYPKRLIVEVVTLDQLKLNFNHSSWFNQQITKLEISRLISSEYYVLLDSKNHFVREIYLSDFIDEGKPILFVDDPGSMINYYQNCLTYYGIYQVSESPSTKKFLTTTPYIIKTQDCREMINHIETKEKIVFSEFFKNNPGKYTEFYLYSTYLLFSDKIKNYVLKPMASISIFGSDPKIHAFNTFDKKKVILTNEKLKTFGLHRGVIQYLDAEYKQNLLNLYSNFYDEVIVEWIKNEILK